MRCATGEYCLFRSPSTLDADTKHRIVKASAGLVGEAAINQNSVSAQYVADASLAPRIVVATSQRLGAPKDLPSLTVFPVYCYY